MDAVIENAISHLRQNFLRSVVTNQSAEKFVTDLAAALGIFSFNHDFVLSESVNVSFQRQSLSVDNPLHLAVLSAYEPLVASDETKNMLSQLKGPHISHLIRVQDDVWVSCMSLGARKRPLRKEL